MRGDITQAPMTKKMLLNSSQRKYLIERIKKHASKLRGVRTLQAKEGSRGYWNIAGDENGVYDFSTEEARDAKIAELMASGAVLK